MLLDDWKTNRPADFPEKTAPLVEAYRHSRELDPRCKFFDYLTKFQTDLQEIIADLQARPPETLEDAAAKWSKTYETRHAQLGEEIKGATTAQTAGHGGGGDGGHGNRQSDLGRCRQGGVDVDCRGVWVEGAVGRGRADLHVRSIANSLSQCGY